jgi:hypothetical protein
MFGDLCVTECADKSDAVRVGGHSSLASLVFAVEISRRPIV